MFNQKNDQDRIAELKTQAAELEATADALRAEKERVLAELEEVADKQLTLQAARQKAIREKGELDAQLEQVKADHAAARERLETASTKLATFDDAVEDAAQARFACLGGDPIPSSGADVNQSQDQIAGLTGLSRATAFHKQKVHRI